MTDIARLADFDPTVPAAKVEAADASPVQDTGFDVVALLLIVLVIITVHILSVGLRDDSPTGQAFKAATLREMLTFILGLVVITMAAGENNTRSSRALSIPAVRWLLTGIGGFYSLYVSLLIVSIGQIFFVGAPLPGILAGVVALLPIFASLGTIISVVLFVLFLSVPIAFIER